MADIADWILGSEDPFPQYGQEDPFEEPYERSVSYKMCRCCGRGQLVWRSVDGKWRLFDGDVMHACPTNPLQERRHD